MSHRRHAKYSVLRAYADENDYTTADINTALDWSIWDDDSPVDQDPVE
jgi:hypothetical protein